MNHLLIKIYRYIPPTFTSWLGKKQSLKNIRDYVLKSNGRYKEGDVYIERNYLNYLCKFRFYASIKDASKAKNSGIENTLLLNSFKLMKSYKKHTNNLVVIDVGANFGYLSLVWATTVCKNNGSVISFEPNVNVCRTFKKSIVINSLEDIVTLNHLAVGSENKDIKLYLENTTSNVLTSEGNKNAEVVEMVTLDSYLDKNNLNQCDMIKIDVDGIELDILKGSVGLIKRFAPVFIVETNTDPRIVDFFNQHNYEIFDMKLNPLHTSESLPSNIFCVPKETGVI